MTRIAVVASLLAISLSTAFAEPDPKKSPAYDHIVLTKGSVTKLEQYLADTADWGTNKDARERARTIIQMVEPGIGRIKKADPAWNLAAWEKTLAAAKARLAAADGVVAKAEEGAQARDGLRREFQSAASRVREAMELLELLDAKPDQVHIQASFKGVEDRLTALVAVKSLDEACKAKNLATAPAEGGKGTYRDPAVGCRLAASHRELAAKYFEAQVRGHVAETVKKLERTTEKAKAGESVEVATHLDLVKPARATDTLRTEFDKLGKAHGYAVDAAWLEPIGAATTGYAAALAEGAKTSRWDAGAKLQDAQITAALAGDHTGKSGALEKGQVLRAASRADWSVETDDFKRPVRRSRSVMALVKIDGETYCRIYERTFEESFTGGAWGKPFGKGGSSFRVSSCK